MIKRREEFYHLSLILRDGQVEAEAGGGAEPEDGEHDGAELGLVLRPHRLLAALAQHDPGDAVDRDVRHHRHAVPGVWEVSRSTYSKTRRKEEDQ